jgi:hypothetical protein
VRERAKRFGTQGNCIWKFAEPRVTLPARGRAVRFLQEGASHVLRRFFGSILYVLGWS